MGPKLLENSKTGSIECPTELLDYLLVEALHSYHKNVPSYSWCSNCLSMSKWQFKLYKFLFKHKTIQWSIWHIQRYLMNFSRPFHFKFIFYQEFSKVEGYHYTVEDNSSEKCAWNLFPITVAILPNYTKVLWKHNYWKTVTLNLLSSWHFYQHFRA